MKSNNRFVLTLCLTAVAWLAGCDSGSSSNSSSSENSANEEATPVATVDAAVTEGPGHTAGAMVVQSTDESEDVFLVANSFDQITATIVSVDLETRTVVLRDEEGEEGAIVLGEEARNIDQVKVGDMVVAEVIAQASVYLIKDPNVELGEAAGETLLRAKEGEMPGASKISESVSVYEVSSINIEDNTFVLTDALGNSQQYTAQNPANLAKGSVGDRVLVEKTIINAIKVEPQQ